MEQTPDEVRAILWKIASDPKQSGTARVAACRLLLMDARERGEGADAGYAADLNRRAIELMKRRVANFDGEMPILYHYKGVAIFANQPAKRVALVKREIDKVNKISDLRRLFEIAGDCSWSPESRLFAGARCRAGLELLTERREARPDIGREDVEARTAGLDSIRWAHPDRHCSDLDMHSERAVERDVPLDEV